MEDFEQIKKFCSGYVDLGKKDGYSMIYRFSRKMRDYYQRKGEYYGTMSLCQAGIVIKADKCDNIDFDYKCFYDYYNDGEIHFDVILEENEVSSLKLKYGEGHVSIKGEGKKIRIYFPYSTQIGIRNIDISGIPLKVKNKPVLSFGDSITQGFMTDKVSKTYPSFIGMMLDSDVYNFGIGGFCFDGGIAGDIDSLPKPRFITVAYGTNDWACEKRYFSRAKEFLSYLSKKYKHRKIFVILPISREIENEKKKFGTLSDVRYEIAKIASRYKNIHVLDCKEGLDFSKSFFADGTHPNEEGMDILSKNILAKIKMDLNKK